MIIKTKDLGNIKIDEKDIITFDGGLYAFEKVKKFALLSDNKESNPFMWLQSAEGPEPRFVVVDPLKVFKGYSVKGSIIKQHLAFEDEKDLRFLAITTVTAGSKEVYVNLKCPIVINARNNTAAQIILDSDDYPIRYYLIKREG